ncbi:hypothetical protein B0H63DRAFT_537959 [Podospora didyma]|uniref:Ankyrin n=1 Tax=Podospora didyma TaxID=330526 RepID=A0AAE0U3T9_9PEZI|nr:hypothetical protein B0H63DRAFT_537959 [Podospora didyma]
MARGADMHCVDEHGLSLLHRAVLAQRVDLIKFLVDNGEDINRRITVPDGYDPLAGRENSEDGDSVPSDDHGSVVQLLTRYTTESQLTPIQLAVLANRQNSVTALIGCHAALHAFCYPAMPLYFGAIRHGTALSEELQKVGSKPLPRDITLSALIAMADILRIDIQGDGEGLTDPCMKSLGRSLSDLQNMHEEQGKTAQTILFHGLEKYQDLYLSTLSKRVLEIVEEVFGKSEKAKATALDGKSKRRWFQEHSRSSNMVAEFGSAGVLALEPPMATST